ncbi:hypothetical protein ACFO0J_04635 [Castellaniella hirudinis]|uniref:Uncharacterized protein n=1 Tax=Castellaniella hirudinis TaxID=1144617 RepID=A0ABV8RY55_9BURK
MIPGVSSDHHTIWITSFFPQAWGQTGILARGQQCRQHGEFIFERIAGVSESRIRPIGNHIAGAVSSRQASFAGLIRRSHGENGPQGFAMRGKAQAADHTKKNPEKSGFEHTFRELHATLRSALK